MLMGNRALSSGRRPKDADDSIDAHLGQARTGGRGMRTRWISWMAWALLLAVPLDAGAFDFLRYEEATIADISASSSTKP